MWLNEQKHYIIFLQETYSTQEVEDIWRTQWQGKLFYSYGSNQSCDVMILVRSDLEFNLTSIKADDNERYIMIEGKVQSLKFLFVNIYAPNKIQEQCRFFDNLIKHLMILLKKKNSG